eukprot:gene2506-2856_t
MTFPWLEIVPLLSKAMPQESLLSMYTTITRLDACKNMCVSNEGIGIEALRLMPSLQHLSIRPIGENIFHHLHEIPLISLYIPQASDQSLPYLQAQTTLTRLDFGVDMDLNIRIPSLAPGFIIKVSIEKSSSSST